MHNAIFLVFFLQILNPVKNAEILAPELVGGQSEMVCGDNWEALVQ